MIKIERNKILSTGLAIVFIFSSLPPYVWAANPLPQNPLQNKIAAKPIVLGSGSITGLTEEVNERINEARNEITNLTTQIRKVSKDNYDRMKSLRDAVQKGQTELKSIEKNLATISNRKSKNKPTNYLQIQEFLKASTAFGKTLTQFVNNFQKSLDQTVTVLQRELTSWELYQTALVNYRSKLIKTYKPGPIPERIKPAPFSPLNPPSPLPFLDARIQSAKFLLIDPAKVIWRDRNTLSRLLNLSPEDGNKMIFVANAIPNQWSDNCVGWNAAACTPGAVIDYVVQLSFKRRLYEFHAGQIDPAKIPEILALGDALSKGADFNSLAITSSDLVWFQSGDTLFSGFPIPAWPVTAYHSVESEINNDSYLQYIIKNLRPGDLVAKSETDRNNNLVRLSYYVGGKDSGLIRTNEINFGADGQYGTEDDFLMDFEISSQGKPIYRTEFSYDPTLNQTSISFFDMTWINPATHQPFKWKLENWVVDNGPDRSFKNDADNKYLVSEKNSYNIFSPNPIWGKRFEFDYSSQEKTTITEFDTVKKDANGNPQVISITEMDNGPAQGPDTGDERPLSYTTFEYDDLGVLVRENQSTFDYSLVGMNRLRALVQDTVRNETSDQTWDFDYDPNKVWMPFHNRLRAVEFSKTDASGKTWHFRSEFDYSKFDASKPNQNLVLVGVRSLDPRVDFKKIFEMKVGGLGARPDGVNDTIRPLITPEDVKYEVRLSSLEPTRTRNWKYIVNLTTRKIESGGKV